MKTGNLIRQPRGTRSVRNGRDAATRVKSVCLRQTSKGNNVEIQGEPPWDAQRGTPLPRAPGARLAASLPCSKVDSLVARESPLLATTTSEPASADRDRAIERRAEFFPQP